MKNVVLVFLYPLILSMLSGCIYNEEIEDNFDTIDNNLEKIDSLTKEVEGGFKENYEVYKKLDTVSYDTSGWTEVNSFEDIDAE